MSTWINGRLRTAIDCRDRGLQYGDGLFETLRIRNRRVRLLEYHLERLYEGCRRLRIAAPDSRKLRGELERCAALRAEGVLKLIVTRGVGSRGYRPSGRERTTRIVSLHALPQGAARGADEAVGVRLCETRLGASPALAGLKTLNRLDSVLARDEWRDPRLWEGLMRDFDNNVISGTMSNLFVRRGSTLITPRLDRCGIAGVMRRWVLEQARSLDLRPIEGRVAQRDLKSADEVFMTNAVAGVVSVGFIQWGGERRKIKDTLAAVRLRERLESL